MCGDLACFKTSTAVYTHINDDTAGAHIHYHFFCIALQKTEDETGRWYPEFFRINFSRCIFCGWCEEACPTFAIQLTPDFEMSEYERPNLVYEKEDLLISGTGKYPGYNFYRVAGVAVGGKDKGESEREEPPFDVRGLMP